MLARHILSFGILCLVATLAQAAPPVLKLSGAWIVAPTAISPAEYHEGWRFAAGPAEGPFRFSSGRRRVPGMTPPSPMDQAAVMGTGRAWSDGRPPLDCARTPMDAYCH